MTNQGKTKGTSSDGQLADSILQALGLLTILAGSFSIQFIKKNPHVLARLSNRNLILIFVPITVLGGSILWISFAHLPRNTFHFWGSLLGGFWIFSIGSVFLSSRIWHRNFEKSRITSNLLKTKVRDFDCLIPYLNDKMKIPLGISLKSGDAFYIPTHQGLEHILICGATGVGKTSSLITMLMHCMRHGLPAIVIDPKGDLVDIDLIREVAKIFGRENDLQVFSLSNTKASRSYNPLKVGSPEQKKSKLMEGLDLEHEYYGAVASKFLGTLFDVLDYFGEKDVNIHRLQSLLINQNERAILEERLNQEPESSEVNDLIAKLASIRQVSVKDIAGLSAQIESFGLREFNGILSPKHNQNGEIDLIEVLQKGKIAYFQMNTNAYGDLSRRIGKLIIQDIKLISNMFQSGELKREFEYAGIFIDEFGAFATKSFANIQKMIRSAHIGLRLFYQGMADLRDVSPEFEKQVLGNSLTKIILRQDINDDVETWSGMAGTVDAYIHSYQTESGLMGSSKTGMGNLHEGKKVKIDFDVFKELGKGQAVVIDKGRKIEDVIQIWDAKDPQYLKQLTELKNSGHIQAHHQVPNSAPQGISAHPLTSTSSSHQVHTKLGPDTPRSHRSATRKVYHSQFQSQHLPVNKKNSAQEAP